MKSEGNSKSLRSLQDLTEYAEYIEFHWKLVEPEPGRNLSQGGQENICIIAIT